jgi:hypothetical protein
MLDGVVARRVEEAWTRSRLQYLHPKLQGDKRARISSEIQVVVELDLNWSKHEAILARERIKLGGLLLSGNKNFVAYGKYRNIIFSTGFKTFSSVMMCSLLENFAIEMYMGSTGACAFHRCAPFCEKCVQLLAQIKKLETCNKLVAHVVCFVPNWQCHVACRLDIWQITYTTTPLLQESVLDHPYSIDIICSFTATQQRHITNNTKLSSFGTRKAQNNGILQLTCLQNWILAVKLSLLLI